jgi:hypothetical protein
MAIRFIIKRERYDGECLNALKIFYETVDAECPELERVLRSGGQGGGPDGDAFDLPMLIGAELREGTQTQQEK